MELTKKQQEGQKTLNSIISKCWEDKEFKQNLITFPVSTIERFTGAPMNIPEDKTLAVSDQTNADFIYVNIPAKPNLDELELTDQQLEMIAGGVTPAILFIAAAALSYEYFSK